MFPINGELVPAIGDNCQLLLEDELSFADCKAESCSFLSKCSLGVFMCFHFCAGEKLSLICAACDCTLRCTNVVFTLWVHQCRNAWSDLLFFFFVVDIWKVSSLHPDQSRSSSCLLGGSHPAPLCRLQVKAGFEEGWGIRWDKGFLTSGEFSQSLRQHREVAGCLLENQGAWGWWDQHCSLQRMSGKILVKGNKVTLLAVCLTSFAKQALEMVLKAWEN